MAAVAERLSAVFHGAELLLSLGRGRHAAAHQSRAGHGRAGGGGPSGQPDRRRDRQPVGQDHRGGRPARLRRRQEDPGKKIKGRKRHIVTDTLGNLVGWLVHPADVQDRDGAAKTLATLRSLYPWLRHVFADGGYAGDKLRGELAEMGRWSLEIIKRSDTAIGFEVLPRRWVVERTFAWLGRCRRLAKDFEATISSATAWLLMAHIRLLTRRLARA